MAKLIISGKNAGVMHEAGHAYSIRSIGDYIDQANDVPLIARVINSTRWSQNLLFWSFIRLSPVCLCECSRMSLP